MSLEAQDVRQVRLARNQTLFRAVNERVEALSDRVAAAEVRHSFGCECSDLSCASQIELTHEEYEHVREGPATFVIAPGHELGLIEVVVARHERYTVVEKIAAAHDVAVATDPRHREDSAA
jgi:hypothetical protein